MQRLRPLAALLLCFLPAVAVAEAPLPAPTAEAAAPTVTIFAAASLKNALDAVAAACKAKSGAAATISYGGSMTLARQIESGAPADIFFAADAASMDYIAQKQLIQPESRADLLGNRLVFVAPRDASIGTLPLTKDALTKAVGDGKIATGDVASVPVGRYAKAAMEKLDLWSTAAPHLAFTDNVRAALAFVARGEATLGIVYLTDAKTEPRVKIVAEIPANAHPPIVYPVALTAAARQGAPARLIACLRGDAAAALWEQQGFSVLRPARLR